MDLLHHEFQCWKDEMGAPAVGHDQRSKTAVPTPGDCPRARAYTRGSDDGPFQMNNVDLNENPISTQAGDRFERIAY